MRTLLELPLDVLSLVLREIRTKRDLRVLCLVCSTLRALVIPSLYRSIDLAVEDALLSPIDIKCFLDARNDGVRFIKKLRIIGDWRYSEATKLFKSSQRMGMINVMVLLLLQRIGKNQLQTFEWLLPSSMSPDVINQLQAHHTNLKKVSWKHETALNGLLFGADPMRLPQLASLSAQNVTTVDQMDYVQRWIASCNSLRKLEISTNWEALKPQIDKIWQGEESKNPVKCFFRDTIEKSERRPRWSKIEVIRGITEPIQCSRASQFSTVSSEDSGVGLDDFCSITERMEAEQMEEVIDHYPFDHRLQLDSLKLAEFPFLNSASLLGTAINLSRLSALTLQACRQTDSLLDFWRLSSCDTINLKKLHLLLPPPSPQDEPLNYQSTIPQSVAAVNKFIASFSGLRDLILLSRLHTRHPMDEISRHSETLERLVLDLKASPRARLYIKHDRVVEIYRNYRRLDELGISIQFTQCFLTLIGFLSKQLTTLQILNTRKDEDAKTRLEDATMIAKTSVANHGSKLRIICMATSSDISSSSQHTMLHVPHYAPHHPMQTQMVPHIVIMQGGEDMGMASGAGMEIGGDYKWGSTRKDVFYVQKAVNILGGNVPILTRISVEKAVELERGRVGILKAGWGKCGYL